MTHLLTIAICAVNKLYESGTNKWLFSYWYLNIGTMEENKAMGSKWVFLEEPFSNIAYLLGTVLANQM